MSEKKKPKDNNAKKPKAKLKRPEKIKPPWMRQYQARRAAFWVMAFGAWFSWAIDRMWQFF